MKVAIVGASGYVGQEIMRIVLRHKYFKLEDAVSNTWSGKELSLVLGKNLNTNSKLFISVDDFMQKYMSYDLIFLALPHGDSVKFYLSIKDFKGKIIDLSSDFRLSSDNYHIWKSDSHICEKTLDKFVYGLADIDENYIKEYKAVANPGCYATSILLGISPTVDKYKNYIQSINIFSMSGVSGAGYKATMKNSFCEISDNAYAYALKNHNHISEMENYLLSKFEFNTKLQFTPHLIPINRGISSTIYIKFDTGTLPDINDLTNYYKSYFSTSKFIYIVDEVPKIKDVSYTNQCHIHIDIDEKTNNIVIISVIDNLVKGASGQAIQNANILFGYNSSEGLMGGYYENS